MRKDLRHEYVGPPTRPPRPSSLWGVAQGRRGGVLRWPERRSPRCGMMAAIPATRDRTAHDEAGAGAEMPSPVGMGWPVRGRGLGPAHGPVQITGLSCVRPIRARGLSCTGCRSCIWRLPCAKGVWPAPMPMSAPASSPPEPPGRKGRMALAALRGRPRQALSRPRLSRRRRVPSSARRGSATAWRRGCPRPPR